MFHYFPSFHLCAYELANLQRKFSDRFSLIGKSVNGMQNEMRMSPPPPHFYYRNDLLALWG